MRSVALFLLLACFASIRVDGRELDFGSAAGPRTDAAARVATAGRLPIRFIRVRGTIETPSLTEIAPGDPVLGRLVELDFDRGLARQMAYFERLAGGRPLIVCVTDGLDELTARHTTAMPLPHVFYMRWEVPLRDGTILTIQEPCPILLFPAHVLQSKSAAELSRTFKHELGHALHGVSAFIHEGDLEETFGQHNLPLRTNGRTALAEGFAEFSAFKFRDSDAENDPRVLGNVMVKRNPRAHRMLLAYYFLGFRAREAISTRISGAELSEVQKRLFAELKRRSGAGSPMTLAEFREGVVRELTGKGKPPMKESELAGQLAEHDRQNGPALANVKAEELSSEERRKLEMAYQSLASSPAATGATTETMEDLLSEASLRELRTPDELFKTEGVVVKLLLALDEEFAAQGIDFYGKALEALARDPYDGRSDPKQPVNLKELLALLDRDPELRGKLLPAVSRATKGALQPRDFRLQPTREVDPLDDPTPGTLEESFRNHRRAAAAKSRATTETTPGFEGLREE